MEKFEKNGDAYSYLEAKYGKWLKKENVSVSDSAKVYDIANAQKETEIAYLEIISQ